MRPIVISFGGLAAADADGIAQSQTPGGAGNLTINGALASGGVATMDKARRVLITAAANESGRIFTVTGTDWFGNTITEAVTGPNATTGYTELDFKTVTSVAINGAATGAVQVGTSGIASSQPIPLDVHGRPDVSLQVTVSGTIDWTVQQTLDPMFVLETASSPTWFDHPDTNMVAETVDRQGNYAYIPTGTRILVNSGTGSGTFTVVQAGDNRA